MRCVEELREPLREMACRRDVLVADDEPECCEVATRNFGGGSFLAISARAAHLRRVHAIGDKRRRQVAALAEG